MQLYDGFNDKCTNYTKECNCNALERKYIKKIHLWVRDATATFNDTNYMQPEQNIE